MSSPSMPQDGRGAPGRGDITRLVRALSLLRARAVVQLGVQRLVLIVAMLVAGVLVVGLLDYFLRLPMGLRVLHWAVGASVLAVLCVRRLWPLVRFKPGLTDLALRLERSEAGKRLGLEGLLASGLELARATPESSVEEELRRASVERAVVAFDSLGRSAGVINPARLWRGIGALALAAAPVAALWVVSPTLSEIGLRRAITPWNATPWPKVTGVADATGLVAHPIGAALPLRAIVTRTDRGPGQTDVGVSYRVSVDGVAGELRRAILTGQGRDAEAPDGQGERGEVYERLIETTGLAPEDHAPHRLTLEYRFDTADDQTPARTIVLVEPPSVAACRIHVEAPAYAAEAIGAGTDFVSGDHDAGNARDERASVGPILAGSVVTVTLRLNRGVPTPDAPGLRDFLARSLPGLENAEGVHATFEGPEWVVSFVAKDSLRVPIALMDEYAIRSTDDAALRLDVAEDRAPVSTVVEPSADETVLPSAVVDLRGESRDDVGLAWSELRVQAARPPGESKGAPPEARGGAEGVARAAPAAGVDQRRLGAAYTLDLSTRDVRAGDEVWVTVEAQDVLGAAMKREPVSSARRRLRVISDSEFIEQVRAELSALREAAKRVDQDQTRLGSQRDAAAASPDAATDQSQAQKGVGDRLNQMRDAASRLEKRAERNRLDNTALNALLQEASDSLKSAGESSREAQDALDNLATLPADAGAQKARDAESQKAEKGQREVSDEMTRLVALLDRGQDNWAARRMIEKLLTEQRQMEQQTRAAEASARGRDASQLDAGQKADLERLAAKQKDLASRSASAVDTLRQRADQLAQADPVQSRGMKQAAEKARREQVTDKQRQAASDIEQNKTGAAQQLQREAGDALESMLEEMDRLDAQREEELRRILTDVKENIRRLATQQEQEIGRLAPALAGNGVPDLDGPMITLNQNTLGVATQAKEVRGGEQVVSLVNAAAGAQSEAIVSLRAQPADYPEAGGAERRSLQKLRDALAEAEKLEQQAEDRDQSRRLAELKKAYGEALEAQATIRAAVTPLAGKALGRRERSEARTQGVSQEELRQRLADLLEQTKDLEEAPIFEYAHRRFDGAAGEAAKVLTDGDVTPAVVRDQNTAVSVLSALVQALADAQKKKDELRDEQAGGGGGGAQGGEGGKRPLIPPLAELKLLRMMQAEAAERTRALGSGGDDAPELEAVGRLQRELGEQARSLLERVNQQNKPPDEKAGGS